MHSSLAALACATVIVATAPRPAAAQSSQTARLHYESGQHHFEAGSYELAIGEFHAALRISGKPALWFNIGQAHRLNGDCVHALEAYQRYAELDPNAARRTNVEARIEEMRQCVAAGDEGRARAARAAPARAAGTAPGQTDEGTGAETPAPASTAPAVSGNAAGTAELVDEPARSPVDGGATLKWLGGGVLVAGLATAGASLYLRQRAAGDADQLSRRYARGGTWDAEAADLEARIAGDKLKSAVFAGIGGLAIGAGIYMYFVGREQDEYARQFTISPRRGGAEAVWSWRF